MTEEGRRLLELLAASEDGSTEALLLAHGFIPPPGQRKDSMTPRIATCAKG
jgi:hypothetical protein